MMTAIANLQRATFTTSRLMEFCHEDELVTLTGQPKENWPLVIAKELIDNAIDEAEEAGIAPVVAVTVNSAEATIAVHERERYRSAGDRPTPRLHQAHLIKGSLCLADPWPTGQRDINVGIETRKSLHRISIRLDPIRQEPVSPLLRVLDSNVRIGTRVTVKLPDSACSIIQAKKADFYKMLDAFAALNPHLTLSLDWDGDKTKWTATDPAWTKWRPSDPTSAHWYSQQRLARLIAAHVARDRDRNTERTVREFVAEFRGLSSSAKQKQVTDSAGLARAPLASLVNPNKGLDTAAITGLLQAMQAATIPVKPIQLGVIGSDNLERRFKAHGAELETYRHKRLTGDSDGMPWVAEIAFAWLGDRGEERKLITGTNFSAAIDNPFRDLDNLLADQWIDKSDPVILAVHFTSPAIAHKDRGKSVALVPADAMEQIEAAVTSVTKAWAKQRWDENRRLSAAANRRAKLIKSAKVGLKEAAWEVMERSYLQASANGRLPANPRQIMYVARPLIEALTGQEVKSQYFTQTLLVDYVHETGVDWDIVWDERGHFAEPHTGLRIGLGTLAVRNYLGDIKNAAWREPSVNPARLVTCGPDKRYGGIMFVEKEGFDPLLERVQLARRHDLAITSTKGMSVTALRQLVDKVCAMGVPLFVFHDFDKAGLSILGTLRRETRRYKFENDIEVIDLGFRIGDIKGLPEEKPQIAAKYNAEKSREARAANMRLNGASEEEVKFLLDKRVELNAMTSDQLVAFIERKLKQHGVKKVIPDRDLLAETYRDNVRAKEIEAEMERLLTGAKESVGGKVAVPPNLEAQVRTYLKKHPTATWDAAIAALVGRRS